MFGRKKKVEPAPEPAPAPTHAMAITVQPVILNPDEHAKRAWAQWRADHIDRWFEQHPEMRELLPAKWLHLEAERDMHRASLRMEPNS